MFSEHIERYIQKVCNLTVYKKLFFYNSFKIIHLDKKYIKIISGTLAHLEERTTEDRKVRGSSLNMLLIKTFSFCRKLKIMLLLTQILQMMRTVILVPLILLIHFWTTMTNLTTILKTVFQFSMNSIV